MARVAAAAEVESGEVGKVKKLFCASLTTISV
jgi:hypothetical protein